MSPQSTPGSWKQACRGHIKGHGAGASTVRKGHRAPRATSRPPRLETWTSTSSLHQAHPISSITMKFSLLAVLGFASLALSAPSALQTRQSTLQTTTDSYVFSISISQFISNRNAQAGPAGLDWSSDGCSSSPDNPFGFDCKSTQQ
jgi:hypothetical protein